MNKLFRRLVWGTGIAVAAITLAIASVILFVDPNDFKDDIAQAVREATGREFQLLGDVQLSLFPWLGLSLGAAQLSNAEGFEDNVFARVESVDIKAKLIPLLQQRIEMKTVHLHGLQVNLSRAVDGRNNWDDLTASPAKESPSDQQAVGDEGPSPSPIAALAIGGVNIEGARIRWDDRQARQQIEVETFDLRTGPIAQGEPIDIQLSTQVSVAEPPLKTAVTLQSTLTMDTHAQQYRIAGLDVKLNLRGDVLPVSPLDVHLTGEVDADVARQLLQFNDVTLHALNMTAKTELALQQFLTAPTFDGQISVDTFSPRELMNVMGVTPPVTADSGVLNKAKISVVVNGSSSALSLSELNLLFDDSKITGGVTITNFSKPEVRYDVSLDAIDADRYLPPEVASVAPVPSGPAAAVAASAELPLELLRGLNVKGDLRAKKFKIAKIRSSDLVLGLRAKNGKVHLSPIKARLYQGNYNGEITLDLRNDTPRVSANEKLSAVNIGPLLKDMLGDEKVSGTVTLAAKLTAEGLTPEAITKSVNGTADFRLNDGAVKGVNLGQMIREAYAKIKKKPAPPKTDNATDFAAVSGSVNIRNGVVDNQDLQAKSPLLRVAGKGRIDLPAQRINYLLNTSIVETDQGQAGKELSGLKALTIPVKITGTFDKPKFKLDLGPVLKAKANEELKRQKKKLKKKAKKKLEKKKSKLKKKLEDKLKEKLKGLF